MLCSICKEKPATVHLTKIIGDKVHKLSLCEDCARQQGLSTVEGFSMADMLFGLGSSEQMEKSTGTDVTCPACGFTQTNFKKIGRLGCPECYTTFAEGLEQILKTMHKGIRHIGKVPRAMQNARTLNDKIKKLQSELEKAVAIEDYERAAVLRDEIKRLRAKLNEPQS